MATDGASENTGETLGNLIPWRRGQPSPNPGGRPKGLASLVREQTADGADLVEFLLKALHNRRLPMRLRLEACAQLLDRGFGKALQQMELTGADGGPMEVVLRYVNDWRSQRERETK